MLRSCLHLFKSIRVDTPGVMSKLFSDWRFFTLLFVAAGFLVFLAMGNPIAWSLLLLFIVALILPEQTVQFFKSARARVGQHSARVKSSYRELREIMYGSPKQSRLDLEDVSQKSQESEEI